MYNDPQQELFTQIRQDIISNGYAVYDGVLPPENTPYPFIYLGDVQQVDDANKSAVFGTVYVTIHVFSDAPRMRGELSLIMLTVKNVCRRLHRTDNFTWHLRGVNQRILPDNTTKTPLLHGVIETEFMFS